MKVNFKILIKEPPDTSCKGHFCDSLKNLYKNSSSEAASEGSYNNININNGLKG